MSQSQIFVPAIGQYDNIGDVVLRRPLLRWVRAAGPLHVFVGRDAPAGYVAALDLGAQDRVYHSFLRWYLAAFAAGLRGRMNYVFKPGEIQMSLRGLKEHVSMLPVLLLARLRGGKVVRIGSGARNFARWPWALLWPSVALSNLVLWRDGDTAAYMGKGGVMPDLGFADGDEAWTRLGRDALVVSMRGDRNPVPETWVAAVRALADHLRLRVTVVTQVARDDAMSLDLARRLNASVLPWDGRDHVAQESALQAVYRRADVVVSDRLHVLVAAFTHGAVPMALLTDQSTKVARHFRAAGIEGVDVGVAGRSVEDLVETMSAIHGRSDALFASLRKARRELDAVRERALSTLSGAPG